MWYQEDPSGMNREELLLLYQTIDQRERAFREDLFRFTNFYSAVCYAILGITLSAFVSLYSKGPIVMVLAFGPALTLAMCILGFRVTAKIYHRVVEEISLKAKLENILGFDCALKVTKFAGSKVLWEEDVSILPPRHQARRSEESCSKDYIDVSAKRSFYRNNRTYFGLIGVFSVILAVAIITGGLFQL